jgi:hypothetical protein
MARRRSAVEVELAIGVVVETVVAGRVFKIARRGQATRIGRVVDEPVAIVVEPVTTRGDEPRDTKTEVGALDRRFAAASLAPPLGQELS